MTKQKDIIKILKQKHLYIHYRTLLNYYLKEFDRINAKYYSTSAFFFPPLMKRFLRAIENGNIKEIIYILRVSVHPCWNKNNFIEYYLYKPKKNII